jgi:hypothetical protein
MHASTNWLSRANVFLTDRNRARSRYRAIDIQARKAVTISDSNTTQRVNWFRAAPVHTMAVSQRVNEVLVMADTNHFAYTVDVHRAGVLRASRSGEN